MCWYEDKGARPEGSGCSVWTSAGAHGSRTQTELGINMDVHQAPCPQPRCSSLCAATVHCVPVNSINSMAATSSHAKVINKHPQMAHNDSLQWDVVRGDCRDKLSLYTALFASQFAGQIVNDFTDSSSQQTTPTASLTFRRNSYSSPLLWQNNRVEVLISEAWKVYVSGLHNQIRALTGGKMWQKLQQIDQKAHMDTLKPA